MQEKNFSWMARGLLEVLSCPECKTGGKKRDTIFRKGTNMETVQVKERTITLFVYLFNSEPNFSLKWVLETQ